MARGYCFLLEMITCGKSGALGILKEQVTLGVAIVKWLVGKSWDLFVF